MFFTIEEKQKKILNISWFSLGVNMQSVFISFKMHSLIFFNLYELFSNFFTFEIFLLFFLLGSKFMNFGPVFVQIFLITLKRFTND